MNKQNIKSKSHIREDIDRKSENQTIGVTSDQQVTEFEGVRRQKDSQIYA